MDIQIDGQAVDPARVGYNSGLNFGRFDHVEPERIRPYTMAIGKAEFITAFSDAYWQILNEVLDDDRAGEESSEFTALDYAPLEKAFDRPEALADVIDTYLGRDYVLAAFFDGTGEGDVFINSIDRILIGDPVVFEGRCFEAG